MAGADRAAAANLEATVLKEPRNYGYFQVYRLLRQIGGSVTSVEGDVEQRIHIRPNLTLAFPESDVDRIDLIEEGNGYRITSNFMGLYGVSSPLPTFYTEDLIDERSHDQSAQRDFVDIFNYSVYHLLFRAWSKSRPMIKVIEERDARFIDRLFAFIGLGEPRVRENLPEQQRLLRHIGLLTQFPRSALGLQTLLGDALGGVRVRVSGCIPIRVEIPEDQRMILGRANGSLGEDSYLGEEIVDRNTNILVRIGPLPYETFHQLLPGEELNLRLKFYTKFYTVNPVRTEVELVLERGQAKPARLGADDDARLGLDTWLYAGEHHDEGYASYIL